MKDYIVVRAYAPVGNAGAKVSLKSDKFTNDLLSKGIISEAKVVEPTEKKTRKPRAKKA